MMFSKKETDEDNDGSVSSHSDHSTCICMPRLAGA